MSTTPDGYETAAGAELGQLVAESATRTGPLDPDAVTFSALLDVDYDKCWVGACAQSTRVPPPPGQRPEMTFWDVHNLIAKATVHGLALKVTAHTCTLIDRALQAAQKHSLRTQHVMLASYHYETLPGRIGGTEVVIVDDVLDTNVRPVNGGWRFMHVDAVDARLDLIATARNAAHAAWRDSYETDRIVPPGQWSKTAVTDLLQGEDDVQDTTALRILANRVAAAAARSSRMYDPQAALVHLARATGAIAVATADITLGQMQVSDTADDVARELAELVRDLVAASAKLEEFGKERF